MTFGREKRLMLGWMALAAPIPLPFNQVLEWPVLFVYCLAVIYFLQRADRAPANWLPNWALNLLGFAYLPFLIFDLRWSFLRQGPVKALLHLILFLVVVKLYSVRHERDKWYLLVAIFFVFLGAMATSSHITIGLYLIAFLAIGLFVLAGLSYLHVLAAFRGGPASAAASQSASAALAALQARVRTGTIRPGRKRRRPSIRRPLVLGTALIVATAVPLFAFMPRIQEPLIFGSGGTSGIGRTTGFSDSVDLSLTSAIRGNRKVAMRVQYAEAVADAGELRFKGAAFDRYENRNWYRNLQQARLLTPRGERTFPLADGEAAAQATIFLEPTGTSSLILPVETLSVKLGGLRAMGIDPGGAVVLPGLPRRETLRYDVDLAAEPRIAARIDPDAASPLSALDTTGVTQRMRALAVELMAETGGDGAPADGGGEDRSSDRERVSDDERIDRLEQALLTGYSYTVDFVGRDGAAPLEDFLFVYRSGHCEYFASAMVLLLRSQGIPARFVTGFLGAEYNPLENYYIVRQQNAHAWVEAYTPTRGWRIYDPTPPDGRPTIAKPSLKLLLTQLYDFVTFRWDRYVLTYGAEDQRSFLQKIRERLQKLWDAVRGREEDPEKAPAGGPAGVESESGGTGGPAVWQPRLPELILLVLTFSAATGLLLWHRRRQLDGCTAYRRLRRRLARAGLEITDDLAPLEVEQLARERYPDAAAALRELVALYLRESFAGRALSASEGHRLRQALSAIFETIRTVAGRQQTATHAAPAPSQA